MTRPAQRLGHPPRGRGTVAGPQVEPESLALPFPDQFLRPGPVPG